MSNLRKLMQVVLHDPDDTDSLMLLASEQHKDRDKYRDELMRLPPRDAVKVWRMVIDAEIADLMTQLVVEEGGKPVQIGVIPGEKPLPEFPKRMAKRDRKAIEDGMAAMRKEVVLKQTQAAAGHEELKAQLRKSIAGLKKMRDELPYDDDD
jgi:hypothetical protein